MRAGGQCGAAALLMGNLLVLGAGPAAAVTLTRDSRGVSHSYALCNPAPPYDCQSGGDFTNAQAVYGIDFAPDILIGVGEPGVTLAAMENVLTATSSDLEISGVGLGATNAAVITNDPSYSNASSDMIIEFTLEQQSTYTLVSSLLAGNLSGGEASVSISLVYLPLFEPQVFVGIRRVDVYASNLEENGANLDLSGVLEPGDYRFRFSAVGRDGGSAQVDFQLLVNAIPEPGSGALLALGLLAMGGTRRRRT